MYVIATVICPNFHFSVSPHVPFLNLLFEQIANSNAYFLAKFGFDTAENEPCQVCPIAPTQAHPRAGEEPRRPERPCGRDPQAEEQALPQLVHRPPEGPSLRAAGYATHEKAQVYICSNSKLERILF